MISSGLSLALLAIVFYAACGVKNRLVISLAQALLPLLVCVDLLVAPHRTGGFGARLVTAPLHTILAFTLWVPWSRSSYAACGMVLASSAAIGVYRHFEYVLIGVFNTNLGEPLAQTLPVPTLLALVSPHCLTLLAALIRLLLIGSPGSDLEKRETAPMLGTRRVLFTVLSQLALLLFIAYNLCLVTFDANLHQYRRMLGERLEPRHMDSYVALVHLYQVALASLQILGMVVLPVAIEPIRRYRPGMSGLYTMPMV